MTDSPGKSEERPEPSGAVTAPASQLPSRPAVLDAVAQALEETGHNWAWQGERDAPDRWTGETGPKDLDVWYQAPPAAPDPVSSLTHRFTSARVAEARDPRRLCHISLAILTATGPAIVDITYGDLRVGPVLLVPAAEVTIEEITAEDVRAGHREGTAVPGNRLTGVAAVADLLVRPVLRGRLPTPCRLAAARTAWMLADPHHREALARRLTRQLGARVAADLIAVAGGGHPDPALPGRARIRLAACSLTLANAAATWSQRHAILPAGPDAGPLGLRIRGVVVALVGTDGAGKSTVADALRRGLLGYGLHSSPAYFGMARGNLPGVALARRLLAVGSTVPMARKDDKSGKGEVSSEPNPAPSARSNAGPSERSGAGPSAGPDAGPGVGANAGPDAGASVGSSSGSSPVSSAGAGVGSSAGTSPGDGRMVSGGAAARRVPVGGGVAGLDRPGLRKVAAWFYAAEYLYRYLRTVAPALARREVVIADRWVYDLRESPWPGSAAARFAEFLVPAPDLLVLPDAPAEVIHHRKPERPLREQAAQQQRYRDLLAEHPARVAELVVDTSGAAGSELGALVAAVVRAAHGPRRRRG